MRALLPHPVRHLAFGLLFTAAVSTTALGQIPQPIGHLSDYGAVLDRHGRERVQGLIEQAWADFGLEVFILVSWENPYDTTDAFALAVADAWSLHAKGSVLLLVLVKAERDWSHAVVGTGDLSRSTAPSRLWDGIEDLVAHRRIEEAMESFFELLPDALGRRPVSPSGAQSPSSAPPSTLTWLIPVIILVAGALLLVIRRFVCPRCGRLLRREADRKGHGVYSCRSCGYRRD